LIRIVNDFVDLHPNANEATYKQLLTTLNSAENLECPEIVADRMLTDRACQVNWNRLIPASTGFELAYIYQATQDKAIEPLLLDSSDIWREILLGLGDNISNMQSNALLLMLEENRKAKRYVIPAVRAPPPCGKPTARW